MRRIRLGLMSAMIVTMTLLVAMPALADVIFCNGGYCSGSNDNDTLYESPWADNIFAGGGSDYIFGDIWGGDRDDVHAGTGRDFIDVQDGDNRDEVNCGRGRDVVWANKGDDIAKNCERVR
jgi:Ca2+-binding RTX toxin-like protein